MGISVGSFLFLVVGEVLFVDRSGTTFFVTSWRLVEIDEGNFSIVATMKCVVGPASERIGSAVKDATSVRTTDGVEKAARFGKTSGDERRLS